MAVGLGMDFKDTPSIQCELIAHQTPNYGIEIIDEEGNIGTNNPLDNKPKAFQILPNRSDVIEVINQIEGVDISMDAGQHMCETVLHDLIMSSNDGNDFLPLFLHTPHLPKIFKNRRDHKNSMKLDKQVSIIQETITKIAAAYLHKRSELWQYFTPNTDTDTIRTYYLHYDVSALTHLLKNLVKRLEELGIYPEIVNGNEVKPLFPIDFQPSQRDNLNQILEEIAIVNGALQEKARDHWD